MNTRFAGVSASERVAISRAHGAEVLFCGRFHVNDALAKARELGRQPGHFCPRQFDSEWNVEENRLVLDPEILAQLPAGRVPDALVAGVGTGGTLLGVGRAFRAINPAMRLFAMEPSESCTLFCDEGEKYLQEHFMRGDSVTVNAGHFA